MSEINRIVKKEKFEEPEAENGDIKSKPLMVTVEERDLFYKEIQGLKD